MMEKLKLLNLVAFVTHLFAGILFFCLTDTDVHVPLYVELLEYVPNATEYFLEPVLEVYSHLSLRLSLFWFEIITSAFHIHNFLRYEEYVNQVQSFTNNLRFLEYAITASIMVVCINVFTSTMNFMQLASQVGFTVMTMMFGSLVQNIPDNDEHQKTKQQMHVLGYVPYAGLMMGLGWNYALNVMNESPPAFVHYIFGTQVSLFTSFGFVQFYQLYTKKYMVGEMAYIVLSLTSKLILAGLIFSNTLAP